MNWIKIITMQPVVVFEAIREVPEDFKKALKNT